MSGVDEARPSAPDAGAWLRWLGGATFVAAGIGFLVEGWRATDVLPRQLLWAGFTLALTVLGILSARRFRDPLGARAFLALAAATVPAHHALVGAAIWGYRHDHTCQLEAVLGAALVLVLVAPALALGVSTLVRHQGLRMTFLLFGFCAPLLLPTRDGNVIAALAALELLGLGWLEATAWRHDPRLQTLSGAGLRLLLLAAPTLLLVRNFFYVATDLWIAATLALPAVVLLALPRLVRLPGSFGLLLQALGVALALLAAGVAAPASPVLGLILAVVCWLSAAWLRDATKLLSYLGGACAVGAALAACFTPDWAYALLVLPCGAAATQLAYRRRSAGLLALAAFTTLVGLAGQLGLAVAWPFQGSWSYAAGLGLFLLLLGSLAESRRATVERFLRHFQPSASPAELDLPE